MKSFGIFCVLALALSLQVARANSTKIQPYSLGVVEGGINYCTKVDSANAAKYKASKVNLLKGLSITALAQARNNSKYGKGYSLANDVYSKMAKQAVLADCAGFRGQT